MTDPTPGQRAYAAYHEGAPLPWDLLPVSAQRQWEAAAQAVLANAQVQLAAAWQRGQDRQSGGEEETSMPHDPTPGQVRSQAAGRREALQAYQCATYELQEGAILCLCCGLRSTHPADTQQRYCGFCDAFHTDWYQEGAACAPGCSLPS